MMKRSRSSSPCHQPSTIMSGGDKDPSIFFKLMLSPTIHFKKLRIPEMFASTFRDELSTVCILTVPTGKTWKVALLREDNELWFHDGWQEFVEYLSIGFAYFLIFKYDGNSNFKVHIFDLTACEISYQPNNAQSSSMVQNDHLSHGVPSEKEPEDDDDHVNVGSLHSPRTNSSNSDIEIIEVDSEDEEMKPHVGGGHSSEAYNASECNSLGLPTWLRGFEGLIEAAAAAGVIMPENPFFVALIKSYALSSGYFLNVPLAFAREHIRCKAGDSIVIESYDGRRWPTRRCGDLNKCALGKGWIVFAREIGLEVGDVCVFELTDATHCVIKVQIAKKYQIKAARQMV